MLGSSLSCVMQEARLGDQVVISAFIVYELKDSEALTCYDDEDHIGTIGR